MTCPALHHHQHQGQLLSPQGEGQGRAHQRVRGRRVLEMGRGVTFRCPQRVNIGRLLTHSPQLSRKTSLVLRIGNLLAGIFASFPECRKAKDTRSSRDYPAAPRDFPSHSGRLPVGTVAGFARNTGRLPSEYPAGILRNTQHALRGVGVAPLGGA